jgi:hypothetical protein
MFERICKTKYTFVVSGCLVLQSWKEYVQAGQCTEPISHRHVDAFANTVTETTVSAMNALYESDEYDFF